jgi:hypothetical protein
LDGSLRLNSRTDGFHHFRFIIQETFIREPDTRATERRECNHLQRRLRDWEIRDGPQSAGLTSNLGVWIGSVPYLLPVDAQSVCARMHYVNSRRQYDFVFQMILHHMHVGSEILDTVVRESLQNVTSCSTQAAGDVPINSWRRDPGCCF